MGLVALEKYEIEKWEIFMSFSNSVMGPSAKLQDIQAAVHQKCNHFRDGFDGSALLCQH